MTSLIDISRSLGSVAAEYPDAALSASASALAAILGQETAGLDRASQEALARERLAQEQGQFETIQSSKQDLLSLLGLGPEGGGLIGNLTSPGFVEGNGGYSDLLNQQRQFAQQTLNDIQGFGAAQLNKINTGFQSALGSSLANLERRGLGASNLAGATRAQTEAQKQQSLLELSDQLLGKRLDTSIGLQQGIFGTQQKQFDEQLARALAGAQAATSLAGSLY